jgi:hypothetical protein
VDGGAADPDLIDYTNVPRSLGIIVSRGKATWADLSTTLGVKDVYDLLEIIAVDDHNARVLREKADRGD